MTKINIVLLVIVLALIPTLLVLSAVWLIVFIIIGVLTWLAWPKLLEVNWRTMTLYGVTILFVGVFYLSGAAPDPKRLPSAGDSRLPILERLLHKSNPHQERADRPPQHNDREELEHRLKQGLVRFRAQDRTVDQAFTLRDKVRQIIEFGEKRNVSIKELLDAKLALDESLKQLGLTSSVELKQRKASLQTFLSKIEETITTVKTDAEMQDLWTDFELNAPKVAFETLSDHIRKLEDALNQFMKELIAEDIQRPQSVSFTLHESANQIRREQIVKISTKRSQLISLDASEWLLEKDPDGRTPKILVSYGEVKDSKPVTDSRRIYVGDGAKFVTLIKRTWVSANLEEVPSYIRIVPFSSFLFTWPRPVAVKIRGLLDLSAVGGPSEYPYAFDVDANAPIEELRLPPWSYFRASIPFTVHPEQPSVYKPEEKLDPNYFRQHNYVTVELLPRFILFRNQIVQDKKQHLFFENISVGLAIMGLGAAVGVIGGIGKK